MKIHGEASPVEGTCVHVPALGYGTRSSMVLVGGQMLWAEGPPCVTPYVEVPLVFK
jgi:hypothetical protein